MMLTDPFRMMTPPPFAMAPHVMVVPVAVIAHFTPIRVMSVPFGMMHADPFRMILVPPPLVAPLMMRVPITVVTVRPTIVTVRRSAIVIMRICHRGRGSEECRQCGGGE